MRHTACTKRNVLLLSGIELRFFGRAARSRVTKSTVLSRLYIHSLVSNLNVLSTPTEKGAYSRIQVGLHLTHKTDNAQRLLSNEMVALLQKVRTGNKYL